MLAFIGLNVAPSALSRAAVDIALGAALLIALGLVNLESAVLRRRVWCADARRDVEVEIAERGFPGFRPSIGVVSCSAFEPPSDVKCSRSCLERDAGRTRSTAGRCAARLQK